MTCDKDCRASRRDSSYLFNSNNHREKTPTKTAILFFVCDSGQTNSGDSSQEVSRYLVIPVNLKRYGTNLLLRKIPDSMSETLVIRGQLHFIVSRTRHHSARQVYVNDPSSTLIIPLNFGMMSRLMIVGRVGFEPTITGARDRYLWPSAL